jgi:ribosome modulation factor
MTKERKTIVKRLREEGKVAAREGKHIQTVPYDLENMDRQQWIRGYREEKQRAINAEKESKSND